MGNARDDRLVQQLRNAERRLAAAEKAQLNVAASTHDGYGGGRPRDRQLARDLNRRIDEANDIDGLRAEVARLRQAVGSEPRTAMDIIAVLGSVVVVVIGLGLVLGFVFFFFFAR